MEEQKKEKSGLTAKDKVIIKDITLLRDILLTMAPWIKNCPENKPTKK